jgi:hypothetical protein
MRKISDFLRIFIAFSNPILFFNEFLSKRFNPFGSKFFKKLSFDYFTVFPTTKSSSKPLLIPRIL